MAGLQPLINLNINFNSSKHGMHVFTKATELVIGFKRVTHRIVKMIGWAN
jgi:hypothetical protein